MRTVASRSPSLMNAIVSGCFVPNPSRSKVTIAFDGYDAAEAAAFVQRFEKAFQRGGG